MLSRRKFLASGGLGIGAIAAGAVGLAEAIPACPLPQSKPQKDGGVRAAIAVIIGLPKRRITGRCPMLKRRTATDAVGNDSRPTWKSVDWVTRLTILEHATDTLWESDMIVGKAPVILGLDCYAWVSRHDTIDKFAKEAMEMFPLATMIRISLTCSGPANQIIYERLDAGWCISEYRARVTDIWSGEPIWQEWAELS